MRVAIHYSDGHHAMYDPTTHKFAGPPEEYQAWLDRNTVEIRDAEWRAYNAFMDQYVAWQQRLLSLDNEIYEKQNKGENK